MSIEVRQSLIARWQRDDDREALEELLKSELAELRERLRGAGAPASPASISDVAQEAVARMLRSDARFPTPAALHSYLWTSARNLLVDRLRSTRRAHLAPRAEDTQALAVDRSTTGELGAIEDADLAAALELALNCLRAPDREILRLVYFDGRSIEQAAAELGVARDVANTRLVRARVRLAEKLGHWREFLGN